MFFHGLLYELYDFPAHLQVVFYGMLEINTLSAKCTFSVGIFLYSEFIGM